VSAVTAYTAHRESASRPPDERFASVHALYDAAPRQLVVCGRTIGTRGETATGVQPFVRCHPRMSPSVIDRATDGLEGLAVERNGQGGGENSIPAQQPEFPMKI